jgi:hypothetical protein
LTLLINAELFACPERSWVDEDRKHDSRGGDVWNPVSLPDSAADIKLVNEAVKFDRRGTQQMN